MLTTEEVREESVCSIVHIGADSTLPSFSRITELEVKVKKNKKQKKMLILLDTTTVFVSFNFLSNCFNLEYVQNVPKTCNVRRRLSATLVLKSTNHAFQ